MVITVAAVRLVLSTLVITRETQLVSFLWVAGFGFLFFNVAYQFILCLCHLLIKKLPVLKEAYVDHFPRVALVYPVRNETHGLFERVGYSFSRNKLPNVDLWILSDSAEGFEQYEREVVERLQRQHPGRVFYRRRKEPVERKQGNIAEFLHAHPEYPLLYICDADGMVPKGTLLKLLKKALHPENRDIAIFQAFVRIAHAATWYARLEKIGADLSQRFSFTAFQAVFGRTISFGHHHLARALADENVKKTYCKIVANFSNLGKRDFWKKMESSSWVYLYDQTGHGPRSYLDLPVTVKGLRDDPYRSLAGAVREADGYKKSNIPFTEFKWANFFRSRITIKGHSDNHFKEAVKEAIKLAKSTQARGLPGYIGE